MLFFFTTLKVKPKRILALYKLRWNIETDLRSLKRTVDLHQVTSKSQAMVEKESYLSASSAGLKPRQLSFSAALPSLYPGGGGPMTTFTDFSSTTLASAFTTALTKKCTWTFVRAAATCTPRSP